VIALTRFRIDMAELEKSMAKIITETGNVITSERRHRDRVEILSQDAEGNFDFFAVHRDGDNTMVLRIQWSREGGESAARLAPLISNSLALSLKGKALALPDLSQEGTWDSFVEAAEAFSKLTREDVIAHQLSLAATGHLKEGYGAEFDYHTFQAARSFQAFNNYPATGLLSERQRELLKKEADILLHSWALKEVTPEGLGATLYVPEGLDLQTSSTGAEHAWTSHTTGFQVTATRYPSTDVAATHAQTVQDANELGATITLNRLKTEQSQLRLRLPKDREFDLRFHQLGSEVLALEVTWDPDKGYYRPQALAALIGQLFEDNLPAGSSTVPDPSTETPEQTDMRQATAEPQSEPAPEKVPSRLATGLFVSGEGHVLTSARHVSGCSSIEVTAQLGASSQASVVARDSTNDFVLLRTSFKSAVHANFRNALRVGEGVLGLGYPETGFAVGRGDVLLGNVTALTGPASDSRFARISLAVGPSHAGGPLMDMKGQVLGILVPGSEALATMASEAGDIPETASYAVKSSLITGFLESNRIPVTRSKEAEEMPVAALSLRANAISATVACVK
jgi:S1-C subfamily serine protease